MKPITNDNKSNGNSSSNVEAILNKLRKAGITAILTMNKKSQMTISNWAHDFVNQYDNILKNNPMKLKNITELPCSKMDAKLAIKLLLLASVEKGLEDDTVVNLRNKFVSLGSFQSVEKKDIKKLLKYISSDQKKSMDTDSLSFPELNKFMDLIISEQKALLEEINSFIVDIQKIKNNTEC